MKLYGKEWDYNVCDCRYCLYWKGLRKGCTYEDGCCCDVPQTPPLPKGATPPPHKEPAAVSECVGCPYGRDSPCIGWCTLKILKEMGRWPR